MALSSFVLKAGICTTFALFSVTSVFSQAHYHANAEEYAIAGHRPGTQTHPDLALGSSGGYLVWEDNVSQANGLGISALGLDSNFAANGRAFRINQNITGDAERPRVALLRNGGAVFVWQAGRQGFQQVYARFLSSSNSWLTGDILVNSFSRNYRINPSATILENGNVLVVWAGYNEFSSTSMQDVYAQIFSPDGQKIGAEFMVNQFSSYNQRTPSAAALHSGGFVVTWVSELQRSGQIDNPDANHAYSTNLPSIEIYGRFFAADGTGAGNEFLVNPTSDVVANPSVAVGSDDSFVVAWSQKNVRIRTNSWDVFARGFSSNGGAGGTRLVNTFVYGDQYAPQVKAQGTDYYVVWSSMGQDGSWEGVYGRYLGADGSPTGDEFRINTTTASRQMHPALASDGTGRFLVVWSGFVGGLNAFDLFSQQYQSDGFVPPTSTPFTYSAPPDSGGNTVPPADSEGSAGGSPGNGVLLAFPGGTAIGAPTANGFAMAQGTYHGLFYEQGGVAAPSAGYVNGKTTANGSYSAKVSLGSRTFAIAGRFNAQGLATNTVARPGGSPLQVELQLDLSGGDQLIGRVTDSHWSATLLANRMVYSKTSPSPQAGIYTLMVAGDPAHSSSSPGGCSFGTAKVDASGAVLMTATLADGTKISQSSAISKQGIWPMYASLSGRGVVVSWIQFANHDKSDLDGQLIWLKSAGASKYYPAGFTNALSASGAAYHAPAAGTRVLNLAQGNLVLSGGGLSESVTNGITLGLNNKFSSTSGKTLMLSIMPATGLFKGTMMNPASGKMVPIQGALSRKANVGVGYFLGDSTSGEVYVGGAQ